MKFMINSESMQLSIESEGVRKDIPLYSKEAFEAISDLWVKVGWNEKYPYTFSWMGRPIIQLPEDMVRTQEVIYRLRPDVIVETGVAHGGSLIFYASLCTAIGKGRVIGIDVEIRPHNRRAIESHGMASLITLIEGNSVSDAVVQQASTLIEPGEKVLVILDSCHTRDHVAKELEAYHSFVGLDSYVVATDGVMQHVCDVPRGAAGWQTDNPVTAVREFLSRHKEFVLEQPGWPFNESSLSKNVTHWPQAWLRRVT